MNFKKRAIKEFTEWYNNLPKYKASGGPAKGTISAALVMLERLKEDFNLDFEFHRAPGGSQINPSKSTWQTIFELLILARETGKEGPVVQHLVGAKLQLRFPNLEVSNESYSTADDQLGRYGDFLLGDTVFHITVAPMMPVFEKCIVNLNNGLRVFLLVPDRVLAAARQNAEYTASGKIAVESIESFIAQNIEELALFSKDKLHSGLRYLLECYNNRVDKAEIDKSMLIELPPNLY